MRLRFIVAAAAMLSSSLAAHADTTFDINGYTADGSQIYGFLYYNPAGGPSGTGAFDFTDITGTYGFGAGTIFGQGDSGGIYSLYTVGEGTLTLSFPDSILNDATSVAACTYENVGQGGCPQDESSYINANPEFYGGPVPDYLIDATITPERSSAVTPEPSSFVLLGTGLLGMAGVMRKRFAR